MGGSSRNFSNTYPLSNKLPHGTERRGVQERCSSCKNKDEEQKQRKSHPFTIYKYTIRTKTTTKVSQYGLNSSSVVWPVLTQVDLLPPARGPQYTAWRTAPWRPPSRWTWCRWTEARGSLWCGCSSEAWPRTLPGSFRQSRESQERPESWTASARTATSSNFIQHMVLLWRNQLTVYLFIYFLGWEKYKK